MTHSIKHLIFLTFLVWITGTLYGCAQNRGSSVREGIEYGVTSKNFSGQWWEFYERGSSFADGGFYHKALADLQQAITRRPQDQWQVQTSDNYFIDYFPHRELGIIYFQLHEYDKAIAELEQSIESAPSAKAHYFLNQTWAARITRYGNDMRAPGLILAGNTTQEITNKFTRIVKGVATDDTFVAAVKVGEQQIPMELAEKKKIFSAEVPLNEGANIIRITATDLAGKSTEKSIEIYSDRWGPQIEIEELTVEKNQVTVKGSVTDDKGTSSLRINNRRWPITGTAPGYNFKVILPEGRITVVARDWAGNVTRAVVREHAFDLLQGDSQAFTDQSAEKSRIDSDPAMPSQDNQPPFIWIADLDPVQETYDDMILLEGRISDSSLLVYITVNGEKLLNRKGKRIYFSLLKKLQEGENKFHIVATDEYGNKADKTITVHRKIPNIRRIDSRMSVAILPFTRISETSRQDDIVHEQMISSFQKQARFNIVEHRKIIVLLHELQLNPSQLANPAQAADFGKIAAVQAVLIGTLVENRDFIEIRGQLVDTETGTILAGNDVFGENKGHGALADLMDRLAFKFKHDFPLIEGTILEVKEDTVLIDAGRGKKIKPGTHLICYREAPPTRHPVTGKLLASEPQIIGRLTVQEVFDDSSRATVENRNTRVVVSDKVIGR